MQMHALPDALLDKRAQMRKTFDCRIGFRIGTWGIGTDRNQVAVLLIARQELFKALHHFQMIFINNILHRTAD